MISKPRARFAPKRAIVPPRSIPGARSSVLRFIRGGNVAPYPPPPLNGETKSRVKRPDVGESSAEC